MTERPTTDLQQRLDAARAALRIGLEQAAALGHGTLIPPQLRASVVQLQADVAVAKAALRAADVAVADAPEDSAELVPALNSTFEQQQGVQGSSFYGPTSITFAAPAAAQEADTYAQYREYLLRLLPPPDAHAAPYLGLLTFQFEHADRFFGRDRLVAELAGRLGSAPFLAVLGASGSGKSSVVRAGLLPLLRAGGLPGSQDWHYITLTPGARPLDSLAAALTQERGGTLLEALELAPRLAADDSALLLAARLFAPRLVLIVDQAEELWTLQPAEPQQRLVWLEHQQRPFLRLLLSALAAPDRPLLVVFTMRADFLHRASDEPGLARAIGDHVVLVSSMTADELRAAIERPARQAGGGFEAGLVDELLARALGEPGALPLLEYTLHELWSRRQADGRMTWACYRDLGGVEGALARRADDILLQHYTPARRDELRRVLLRLIQPGEGAADTRRRVALADLAGAGQSPDEVRVLLQPLIDARLLTSGRGHGQQPTVEVSHEALIRSWPTLRAWLDEERADLRLQIRFEEAAQEWRAGGENPGLLWEGLKLSNAEAWVQRARPLLSARDMAFLDACHAEARRKIEAQALARRASRRLRWLASLMIGLLALTLIAAAVAVILQRQVAAQNQLNDAQRLAYAASSQITENSEVALLLAAEAVARVARPGTEQVLRAALVAYPARVRVLAGHTAAVWSARFSPDGRRIVTTSADGTARVWSVAGRAEATLRGHSNIVREAEFSPDGAWIVTVSNDRTVRIWRVDGTPAARLEGHTDAVSSARFSPDGRRLVTASYDHSARVWQADGTPLATLQGHTDRVRSAVFSPDGTRIVTASADGTARVYTAEGAFLFVLLGHTEGLSMALFSPDGTRIVTVSDDNTARLWRADGGLLAVLQGHTQLLRMAAFSPDGRHVFTVAEDGMLRVWLGDGTLVNTHQIGVYIGADTAFSPDGLSVVTTSGVIGKGARVWPVGGGSPIVLQGHADRVLGADFSPDGARIVTSSADGTARVWWDDYALLARVRVQAAQSRGDRLLQPTNMAWMRGALAGPDGQLIATPVATDLARLQRMSGAELLAVAACRLPRGLSAEEIQRFEVGTPRFELARGQCGD